MTRCSSIFIMVFLLGCSGGGFRPSNEQLIPFEIARRVADRILKDTQFELRDMQQKPVGGIQVVDFAKAFAGSRGQFATASSILTVERPCTLTAGLSSSRPLELYVNGIRVFRTVNERAFAFREIAYEIYEFQDTLQISLNAGRNDVTIRSTIADGNAVYFRELFSPGTAAAASFLLPDTSWGEVLWPWQYRSEDGTMSVIRPGAVSRFVIPEHSAFKRDAYAEWHYAHGSMMFALAQFGESLKESRYIDFVKRYCDYTMETLPLFKKQYTVDHDLQTSNYRIFRKGMLDDTGAPVLPFIELMFQENADTYAGLVREMAEYVSRGQMRLPDGTLCRPEPELHTTWADDLFMSVPLLLRMAKWTGDHTYADDAARQVVNFHSYLFDPAASVYRHCYYADRQQPSPARWGRANGWVVWATTEALLHLPSDHPRRAAILKNFQAHMTGLVAFQDSSGMWHQLLDDPASYEETSCTAMYIIGLARGLRYGWLDESYQQPLARAWRALVQRIDTDGVVRDITAGTSVSQDLDYYRKRPRYPNDPRGLGAVLTACREMSQ